MSIRAMNWAWEQKVESDGEKLLLMAIADRANDDGECWQGRTGLGEKVGRSERTVSERIKRMEAAHLLHRVERCRDDGSQTTNLIVLHLDPLQDPARAPADSLQPVTQNSVAATSTTNLLGEAVEPLTKKVSVDKRQLTDGEFQLGSQILLAFNRANGSNWNSLTTRDQPSPNLKMIVMRIREHPEVDLAQHRTMIENAFRDPWWAKGGKPKKAGSVGVLYSEASFPRAVATEGRPTDTRRFEGERTVEEQLGGKDAPW